MCKSCSRRLYLPAAAQLFRNCWMLAQTKLTQNRRLQTHTTHSFMNKTQFTLLLLNTHDRARWYFAKLKYHVQFGCAFDCVRYIFTHSPGRPFRAKFWRRIRFECNNRINYYDNNPIIPFCILIFGPISLDSNCIFVHNFKWFHLFLFTAVCVPPLLRCSAAIGIVVIIVTLRSLAAPHHKLPVNGKMNRNVFDTKMERAQVCANQRTEWTRKKRQKE